MAKEVTYQEELVAQQRRSAESIYRMSEMPTRPKKVTAAEMAAFKKANADLYEKGRKR